MKKRSVYRLVERVARHPKRTTDIFYILLEITVFHHSATSCCEFIVADLIRLLQQHF